MILENKEKRDGVKRKLEETRSKIRTDAVKYEVLNEHTNLSLGKLCANGMHTLSRPEVLDCAQHHQGVRDKEKQKRANNETTQKANLERQVSDAINRFWLSLPFCRADYQALVTEFCSLLANVKKQHEIIAKSIAIFEDLVLMLSRMHCINQLFLLVHVTDKRMLPLIIPVLIILMKVLQRPVTTTSMRWICSLFCQRWCWRM
jgi:hypothetical protein